MGKASKPKDAAETKPLTMSQKLDALGIDAVCERIAGGESQPILAQALGVSLGGLSLWLSHGDRPARAREAMATSARLWDERAITVLQDANEDKPGAVAKAREIASHYRWRAKCYAPKDYGDKLDLNAAVTVQTMTDEQLAAKAMVLQAKLGIGKVGN